MSSPRRLVLSFVLVLLLPAIAVVWLGARLIQQDRELESRQLAERQQAAADRVVALLEQAVAATERRLLAAAPVIPIGPNDDAVFVTFSPGGIEASPTNHLLYYPDFVDAAAESDLVFEPGELLEHQQRDYAAAAEFFRRLTTSPYVSIKVGALLRLARNQRRLQQPREALRSYAELATFDEAQVNGLPAGLVGRRARCLLLDELTLNADRDREARALRHDLLTARWRISRATLDTYLAETTAWVGNVELPNERFALAAAVEWLVAWKAKQGETDSAGAGRRAFRSNGTPITMLWQSTAERTVALVAGPAFQQREWFSTATNQSGDGPFRVALFDDDGGSVFGQTKAAVPAVKRSAAETRLPWTVAIADGQLTSGIAEFRDRRLTIVLALVLVGVIVIVGGTFTLRAVSRELAAAQLQSDFVSAVSHEFRTPLTSLRQFTDLLNDEPEPAPAKRRLFYQAQARSTVRLQRLVESLLDFGRMQAGVRPYRLVPTSLDELVRTLLDDFRREAALEGFTIQLDLPPGPVAVVGDPDALTRAIWNLLDNAVKYSGAGSFVSVVVTVDDGAAAVSVRDEGVGIPREEHDAIFQKFVRGRGTSDGRIAGTGIGLAMVRHIVRAHSGSVSVDSAPDRGSVFTIVLPLAAAAQLAPAPSGIPGEADEWRASL